MTGIATPINFYQTSNGFVTVSPSSPVSTHIITSSTYYGTVSNNINMVNSSPVGIIFHVYYPIISELISTTALPVGNMHYYNVVSNIIGMHDPVPISGVNGLYFFLVLSSIKVTPTLIPIISRNAYITEYFSLIDNFINTIFDGVTEQTMISSSLSAINNHLITIYEGIIQSGNVSSLAYLYNNILQSIKTVDNLLLFKAISITEYANLSGLFNVYSNLLNVITQGLSITPLLTPSSIRIISLSDNFNLNSSILNLANVFNGIKELFVITLPPDYSQDSYLAYLLSPETMYVSQYSNYNFNGGTKFDHDYLFYNSSGLYKYGGTTDNGTAVTSTVETIAFNFDSSNRKQLPAIYLGVISSGQTYLKVKTDGKNESYYLLNKMTGNLHTQKIAIGKGLISRYFQFELVTQADTFNMESIDFYPIELHRKL